MVGWHHRLDRHEFEQVPGVDDGQGSLVCCSPWCHKESDMIEGLNWHKQSSLLRGMHLVFLCGKELIVLWSIWLWVM